MSLRFGTDGVRGVANSELTPEIALSLGRAAAKVLGGSRFLVGRDPRRSGPLLLGAFAAGLCSEGVDVVDLGVVPTPCVAWESASMRLPAAMISASHNLFEDNGIKLFSAGGRKLPDDVEARIEAAMASGAVGAEPPVGVDVGSVHDGRTGAASGYSDGLVDGLDGRRLEGLRVVIDCANGSASHIAPAVLRRLAPAQLTVLHASPDGININADCGSTHLGSLQAAVVRHRADVGLGFDGDADRVLAVDHQGEVVDGDQIMAMCALDLRDRGILTNDTVVVTVMSNLGFKQAMAHAGIEVVTTDVGDRYVLDAMEAGGCSLGGEQSGHVIFGDRATTGDGLLSGLSVLDLMVRSQRTLADLASVMTRLPQVLRSVRGVDRAKLATAERLWAEVAAVEAELGESGRVNLRPSGTEPVVRVMVEAPTAAAAEAACARLCSVVERELAGRLP